MLIDTHCHLDRLKLNVYGGSLDAALQAARDRGVERFLNISIDSQNALQVIEIAERHEDVFAAVGLHPLEFNAPREGEVCASSSLIAQDNFEQELEQWLLERSKHPKVKAIGETGLDYYYSDDFIERQKKSFEMHLKVAKSRQLPVVVHTRDARADTLSLLKNHACASAAGVLHCFTESWEMASAALDLGFYISFSGIITFKNAAELREVVKKIPLDRILVETDSPYLAPVPFRGKPNEPKNVLEVAKCVAELKGLTCEQLCEITGANAERLFRFAV